MAPHISGVNVGRGLLDFRWTGLGVNRNSKAVASISEVTDPGGEPMLGNANLSVLSVSPNDAGELWIRINIDWPSDLHYKVTAIIE